MHFLNPLAFWTLPALLLVIWLHFRHRPQRHYWVSDVNLWRTRQSPIASRVRHKQIDHIWLLILHLLFLSVLITVLAQPVLPWYPAPGRQVVFVIDASASMLSMEQGQTRFDMARAMASAMIETLDPEDQARIILAAAQPVVATDFTADKQRLNRAMKRLSPTHTVADLTTAVLLATGATTEAGTRDVYLFSDGTENARLPPALHLPHLHYIQVGNSADNVAITRLDIRSNPHSPYDREIYTELVNLSDRPHRARFTMTIGALILQDRQLELTAGAQQVIVSTLSGVQQGVLHALLNATDSLAVDNHAYAVVNLPRPIDVLLVSTGNFFVEKALRTNPLLKPTVMDPATYAQQASHSPYDVVIFDRVQPRDLPPGRYVMLRSDGQRLRQPRITIAMPHHPVLALIDANAWVIEQAFALTVPPGATPLMTANDLPVLVTHEDDGSKTVITGLDLQSADLGLSVSFPILISNIIRWLTAPQPSNTRQLIAGTPLHWDMMPSPDLASVIITNPQGRSVSSAITAQRLVFEQTAYTGIYTVNGNHYRQRFAVNLFNKAESTIAPVFFPADAMLPPSTDPVNIKETIDLRQYLLAMALLLLILESCYERIVIG